MASRSPIVDEAIDFLKVAKKANDSQREREREDLKFQIPEMTWSEEARAARMSTTINGVPIPARPMLSLATLDEPLQLVENAYRDAHLGVNIHPMSPDASDDTAQVLQGIYRSIEVHSRASALPRGWSFARSLRCGTGAYRVASEYDYDSGVPGDQRLVLKRILFQESVYLDPFAQEPDWSDGERAAIIEDVPWTTYKRKYKTNADGQRSKLLSYSDNDLMSLGQELPDWVGGEGPESRTVRIAEYFYVEHDSEPMTIPGAGPDGSDFTLDKDIRRVKWAKVNGVEVLEEGEWPGPYIPIIPTIGKELQPIDGKRRWIGMISNAKDGVRLVNYAASGAVEMAALEPKAPWQMEAGVDTGFEWEYQQANIRNFPVLHFNGTNALGQRAERPQRVQVDAGRLGPNMMLLSMGKEFVQSATQTYDPQLGKQTPAHRSGEAIKALQGQGVEGTSNYTLNLADVSMTYEAMVILAAIPYFYDRPGRIVQIMDGEDKPRSVMLNQPYVQHPQTQQMLPMPGGQPPPPAPAPPQQPGDVLGLQTAPPQPKVYHYDLKKGRYGVTVTVGKSSKSKLEQGQTEIGDILQSDPALMPLIGPVYFKYRDGPGMREIAQILQKQRDHMMPWLSDNPQAQPDPHQLMAENQQLKQQLQQAGQIIQTKQVEQQGKLQVAQVQSQSDLQTTQMNNETKIAVAELSAKVERLALFLEERARIGAHIADTSSQMHAQAHELGIAAVQQQHDAAMARQDAAHQADASAQDHGQATAQNQQTADNALIQQAAAPTPEGQ